MICDRCYKESLGSTGSYFNTQIICFACSKIEREHPAFEEAQRVENEAVKRGDFNYPGIGLPTDLVGGGR